MCKNKLIKLFGIKRLEFAFSLYNKVFLRKYLLKEKQIVAELKRIESFDEDNVANLQNDKLSSILSYAYKNTNYYKSLFDNHNIDPGKLKSLKSIPILTKDIIRKNHDQLISKEFSKKSLVKRNTGGSTGEPLEFYSDKMSGHIDIAHHWYLYSLMGYKTGDIILSCGGTYIQKELRDQNIYWVEDFSDKVWGRYDFSVLYITESNIKYYIEKLIKIKPSILRGYPSFFDMLATYIIKNNISLGFKIKGINLTAEMCSLSQRSNIETAFSSMIYFEYGHSEICLFCYTQDDSYLYKSSPIYGYIEVLKENGKEAQIGEIGNIIVTGFNNYGMPFIRYDTGDMGEVSYRNGGIIHFKDIHGRNQDYIVSKDNQKVFLTALIFGQHLRAFKNITKWQLFQNIIGKVQINIVKGDSYSSLDENEITKNFKNVINIDISFHYVDKIPLTKSGKHLFLIQNLKSNL